MLPRFRALRHSLLGRLQRGVPRSADLAVAGVYTAGDTVTEDPGSAAVTCFFPEPLTTRGEARAIARLAADNGWENLIVVTSRYHLLRAETNLSQCTTAELTMVGSDPELSPMQWLGRFAEETGGLAAAALRPACANPV
ncbi:YdcF family protein [Arthrobacter sp. zg-ZUI100]|uniref:ElyC/SanA/YdcF family protein n=1 Tax=Arthrobacter jiangjiafuii TaxID=2817475 RepID=UPI001AED795E|nr:ElyC/SanA/YdcF family protein [Arthrobacter jiangjiafuii]MBP3035910.1 YdcF family protein [Arthrobacter jiangjiafuii]